LEKINSEELTTYITTILDTLNKAKTDGFRLNVPIEFELAIINKKEKGGGIEIFIADAKGKVEKEHISKIKFSYTWDF